MTLLEAYEINRQQKNKAWKAWKLAERAGDIEAAAEHKARYEVFVEAMSEILIQIEGVKRW